MNQTQEKKQIKILDQYDRRNAQIYYSMKFNELIDSGRYWEATELMEKVKHFIQKDDKAADPKIYYDMDWEKFFEGMCCYAGTDSCLSGVGGCGGCGSILCASYCLCFCCTGERPAEGCDFIANCWDNCFCIDILCGDMCDVFDEKCCRC